MTQNDTQLEGVRFIKINHETLLLLIVSHTDLYAKTKILSFSEFSLSSEWVLLTIFMFSTGKTAFLLHGHFISFIKCVVVF